MNHEIKSDTGRFSKLTSLSDQELCKLLNTCDLSVDTVAISKEAFRDSLRLVYRNQQSSRNDSVLLAHAIQQILSKK